MAALSGVASEPVLLLRKLAVSWAPRLKGTPMQILFFVVLGLLVLMIASNVVAVRAMKKLKGQAVPETGMVADTAHPSLYYFFSPTCGPCRQMSPVVDKIAADHPNVFKVDITQDRATAAKFGVMGVPATVIVDAGGTVKEVLVGAKPMSTVLNLLES